MKKQELLWWIYALLFLLGVYFFTRFVSIRLLPPFNDEFIYVRWAQEGFFDPARRLASLSDGKQPLYIWLVSLMMNLVPSPLAAGRIVSILAGAASTLGLVVFAYQMFKKRAIAIVAGALYILSPLALLLDRFALYDSLLTALTVWGLVVMHALTRSPTLGVSLTLALLLGAALLTKSSAQLLVGIFFLMAVFLPKKGKQNFLSLGYLLLASAVAWVYQSFQQLLPTARAVGDKNNAFVYSWDELKLLRFVPFVWHNFLLYGSWIVTYFSLPLLLLCAYGWLTDRNRRRAYTFLGLAFLLPFFIVVVVGKTVYPRHIFFLTVPLIVLAAGSVVQLWRSLRNSWVRVALIVLLLLQVVYLDGRILVDFKTAPLPAVDRFQYIDGWPAGWGMKEVVRILESEAAKGALIVLTEGKFGSMPTTTMQLYFSNYPQVQIWPIDEATLRIPRDINWNLPVYVLLNQTQQQPQGWKAEEILKVQKGTGGSYMRLLKLPPTGLKGTLLQETL